MGAHHRLKLGVGQGHRDLGKQMKGIFHLGLLLAHGRETSYMSPLTSMAAQSETLMESSEGYMLQGSQL